MPTVLRSLLRILLPCNPKTLLNSRRLCVFVSLQAVLRSLRIVLRSIATRALAQKRYRLYAEPPLPDEAGGFEALQALSCPMDLLTMLYKVCSVWLWCRAAAQLLTRWSSGAAP
jgi:hypothetical protein